MRQRRVTAMALVLVVLPMAACTTLTSPRAAAPPSPETGPAAAPAQTPSVVGGVELPRQDHVTARVESATFIDASRTPTLQPDLVSRVRSGIARSLAGVGRSVVQLIEDLR